MSHFTSYTYIHTYIYNIWPFYRCLIGISMLIIGLVSPNWHPMAYPESPGGEEAIAQAPVPPRSSGPPTVPPGRHDVAGTALFTTQDTLRSLFGMFEWKRTWKIDVICVEFHLFIFVNLFGGKNADSGVFLQFCFVLLWRGLDTCMDANMWERLVHKLNDYIKRKNNECVFSTALSVCKMWMNVQHFPL